MKKDFAQYLAISFVLMTIFVIAEGIYILGAVWVVGCYVAAGAFARLMTLLERENGPWF